MATKNIVEKLIEKHASNNPFIIAENLNVIIIYSNMRNTLGFFSKYNRSKFIHLNCNLNNNLKNFVCAHELGHSILHPDVNTPFLKKHTLFSMDKIEREANKFAVELLLPDKLLQEYGECSLFNIAPIMGVPDKLTSLKLS